MTVPEVLSLFETTKDQRAIFVRSVVEAIENRQVNPLKIHLQLKAIEDIIASLTSTDEKKNKNIEYAKKYKKYLLEEADKNGKDFEYHNAKFSVGEVGTKYDYSKCGDAELLDLYRQAEELKTKIAQREKFLQNIPDEGCLFINESTGEAMTLYKPVKTSTTSVKVTLK